MANNSKKYISLNRLSDFLDNLKDIFANIHHTHKVSDLTDYKVDAELSSTSTNPIANSVVSDEFEAIGESFGAVTGVLETMGDAIDALGNHNHNDIYYTQSEIDNTFDEIEAVIDGKADASHIHAIEDVTNLQSTLDEKVPVSRTINGKALSSNILLSASDVGAAPAGYGWGETKGKTVTDYNDCVLGGFYNGDNAVNGAPFISNAPYSNVVVSRGTTKIYQTMYSVGQIAHRYSPDNGVTWTDWVDISPSAFTPAGYGLGEVKAKYVAAPEDISESGFYRSIAPSISSGNAWYICISYGATEKTVFGFKETVSGIAFMRTMKAGVWGEWEWVNPPMTAGNEYRTTERWHTKAVYKRTTSDGKVQYRLDGETDWKNYADIVGAAPAGYGLGEGAITIDSWDNAVANGWYYSNGNAPDTNFWFGMVVKHPNSSALSQTLYLHLVADSITRISVRGRDANGVWGAWEWVNPPMKSDVEYRTIERIGSKAVYKKNVNGVIQYRLDGETTWKNYADLVGAAASSHTHNYAGSSSAGGAANYAQKLQTYKTDSTTETFGTSYPAYLQWETSKRLKLKCDGYTTEVDRLSSDAGSTTQPVYFSNGVPVKTTYTLGASVPSGAKFTDTTYSNFVKSGSGAKAGLVPAPSTTAGTTKYLREDGTWTVPPDTNTVYTHPTSSGNKHIPSGGSSGQILRWSADGTAVWGNDNNTTYSAATQSAQGLMSAADKKKLDGIASGANAYSLPTASSSTLGGVKTTSTVTSTSGLTPCPIISGVPYYKEGSSSGSYLPLSGGTLTGAVTLNNNINLNVKNTSGTAQSIIKMDTSNNMVIGAGECNIMKLALNADRTQIFSDSRIDFLPGGSASTEYAALSIVVDQSDRAILRPTVTGGGALGTSDYRFFTVYLQSSANVSSDRRLKDNIQDIDNKYIQLWDELQPKTYYIKDDKESGKHIGFIAQDVEEAMLKVGLSHDDCSFLHKDWVEREDYTGYEYSLTYDDLAVLTTAKSKKQQQEINELKNELAELKALIAEKLG